MSELGDILRALATACDERPDRDDRERIDITIHPRTGRFEMHSHVDARDFDRPSILETNHNQENPPS